MTTAATSRRMVRQKTRGTGPEVALRAALEAAGIPTLANVANLPGTPDLVVLAPRVAVFVHGCFWHGCGRHWKPPATNREFWGAKIVANARRHRAACRALHAAGWAVLTFWEHEIVGTGGAGARRGRERDPWNGLARAVSAIRDAIQKNATRILPEAER